MGYYKRNNPYAAKVKENVLNKIIELIEKNKINRRELTGAYADKDRHVIDYEKIMEEIYTIW